MLTKERDFLKEQLASVLKKDVSSKKTFRRCNKSLFRNHQKSSSESSDYSSPLSSDDEGKKKTKKKKAIKRMWKEKGKKSEKIKDKDYQRAKSPNQVVDRYQSLLKLYRKGGTMA